MGIKTMYFNIKVSCICPNLAQLSSGLTPLISYTVNIYNIIELSMIKDDGLLYQLTIYNITSI